ncbi:DUF222 domain-containing protein [Brachybacterium fresconis]
MEVAAGDGGVVVGGVELSAVIGVLAELGARGSSSLEGLSGVETIRVLTGLRELSSAMAAVQARALVHLETAAKDDALARGERGRAAVKTARSEASFALKASPAAAGQTMSSSRRLVASMPGMVAALSRGQASPAAAHRVGKVLASASPALRSEVDEVLTERLTDLEGCGVEEWGSETEKVLHALDPDGAAGRHLRARQQRGVTMRRGEDGMSTLTARVSAMDAARIRKRLALGAEKARVGGDRRGHQQIMADQFVDVLLDRGAREGPGSVGVTTMEIGVIITDRSLLAPAHADAAVIEGVGSVPYEHVREEMLQAITAANGPGVKLALRNLYIDPEDGQLVAVQSRSRAFPPALSRFLRWSHLTCRAPYCDAPIRQIDHITPHARGGATSRDNGNSLCAGDNQKEEAGVTARVITDAHGRRASVEWTTRYGQKARRAGHSFDPVGTARHRLARRPTPADPADPCDPATTVRTRWTAWVIEGMHGPVPARTGTTATLEKALDRVGRSTTTTTSPHLAADGWPGYRRYQHTGRTDLIVTPDLIFTTNHTHPDQPDRMQDATGDGRTRGIMPRWT